MFPLFTEKSILEKAANYLCTLWIWSCGYTNFLGRLFWFLWQARKCFALLTGQTVLKSRLTIYVLLKMVMLWLVGYLRMFLWFLWQIIKFFCIIYRKKTLLRRRLIMLVLLRLGELRKKIVMVPVTNWCFFFFHYLYEKHYWEVGWSC